MIIHWSFNFFLLHNKKDKKDTSQITSIFQARVTEWLCQRLNRKNGKESLFGWRVGTERKMSWFFFQCKVTTDI